MSKMSRSPDRHSFQKRSYERKIAAAESQESVDSAKQMLELYKTWNEQDMELEANPDWQKNNMSYDLCTTDWILAKVRASETYSQNLYAAMCNNSFQRLDVWPILKDEYWSCSWRSAGGIIADMRQQGDYIDWYCSGMGGLNQDYEGNESDEDWQKRTSYVPECTVTEEIEQDLNKLGWRVIRDDN
jgi:hypothetical protein